MPNKYNFLILTVMNGGIISAALGLIKEKERQGDKAMDRIHDGMKTQMELTANQGSWTGDSKAPSQVVKEKVVEKEKIKEPEPEEDKPEATKTEVASASANEDKKEDDIANMGIIGLAQSASK